MKFDFLDCITALDTGQDILVIYHLFSTILAHRLNVKLSVGRNDPRVPSVTGFWRAATAYEREAHEKLGIRFEGHAGMGSLLLPEDWHGHPLRKDYVFPQEYQGVEHRRAPLRKEHARP
jgi:NADH-quinone oxidoreductase subunit C